MEYRIRIPIRDKFLATEIRLDDQTAIVEGLNNKKIFENTLRIPFPYTAEHARTWIETVVKLTADADQVTNFAIRDKSARIIGGFSFEQPSYEHARRSEIGYWLAEEFWNQGLMTDAIGALCKFGFEKLGLVKITASVFDYNVASARVLEKNGFQLEGKMVKHYLKGDKEIDALAYGKLNDA